MPLSFKNDLYSNLYQQSQYKLTWYFNIILLILLPILAGALYLLEEPAAFPSLLAFIGSVFIYFQLKTTKKFKNAAKTLSIIGLILCQYTLNFLPTAFHFVDTMWIMVIVLFTFFTVGNIWGAFNLFLNLIGVSYYILFKLQNNLQSLKPLENKDLIALTVNFIICILIISYMMIQFIKLNKSAEQKHIQIASSLKDKNEEKTVLLKEVHHRVKNNLQVIISLLRLQLQDLNDDSLVKPYNESINRVMAMSLIHEKIYQSADLAKINLKSYIESLIADLITSYSIENKISYHIESDIDTINIKNLVPTALLLNELISNSIQHGFKNSNNPLIKVSINKQKDALLIDYSDNGIWINEQRKGSLGMELISSLTEQLNGKYTRTTNHGTHYFFEFNNYFV